MNPLWSAAELGAVFGASGFAVSGISIDTRTLKPGDLFVALLAARDGHDFVADALAKGAAGVLVSRPVAGPHMLVEDTLAALQRLGEAARARSRARLVAVTGSVGKTTVKEMLRRCLGAFGAVHAADASFNNHIGVPLTLARMPGDADFCILEIGMNHPGEILPLARLALPDVAVITNVERAHIGLMGSEAAIAREKATIFQALRPGGAAVLPAQSRFLEILRAAVPAGVRRVEVAEADIRTLAQAADGSDIDAVAAGAQVAFRLAAPGRHMAMNALLALNAVAALGLEVPKAAAALSGFAPFGGRGARREIPLPGGPALLLDESYNASAASVRAALAVLALQPGRHVAVLGDMLELGEHAEAEHLSLRPALLGAADIAFTCGTAIKILFDSLPGPMQGAHAPDAASLGQLLKPRLRPNDAVLVKGSYGSRMRDVILALEGRD